jgi:hypothetical protein
MIPCDISSTVGAVTLILTEVIMKRVALFGMVAAAIVSAGTFLAAQSGPLGKQEVSPGAPVTTQALPPAGVASLLRPMTPLQQRFMDLSAKKAHLMTEEQLQRAVRNLDQEVEGLTAWSKLEEAARLLREVEEKHPETKAAEAAKSALGIIERNRPSSAPFPDPMGRIGERIGEKRPVPADATFAAPHETPFDSK